MNSKTQCAISGALASRPAVALADEPTAALNTERGLAVKGLLRTTSAEQDTATLLVTHDTRMIGEVDRVIHLMMDVLRMSKKPGPNGTCAEARRIVVDARVRRGCCG